MHRCTFWLAAAVVIATLIGAAGHARQAPPGEEMAAAARRLLDTLGPELRARCALPLENAARTNWQFVPADRAGISLSEMNDAQRLAARDLLRSALSSAGVLKVESIMELENVLREIEHAAGHEADAALRIPLRYSVAVFGEPGTAKDAGGKGGAWGWRIEGHHVSLNFTLVAGRVVSVTPSFLGASPAQVPSGPMAGRRALAAEEDLARELLSSLDEKQRGVAMIAPKSPGNILTLPGRPFGSATPAGLETAAMTEPQRLILRRLIEEFAGRLRPELAQEQLVRMLGDQLEAGGVRFAWAGSTVRGEGHYYRVTGRTFVIEYDNTQNDANHVHTVWHDLERDFGGDALREHLERDHHAHNPDR